MDVESLNCEDGMDLGYLVGRCVHGNELFISMHSAEFFEPLRNWKLLKTDCAARSLLNRQDSSDSDASQKVPRWQGLVIQQETRRGLEDRGMVYGQK